MTTTSQDAKTFDQAVAVRSTGERTYSAAVAPDWDGPLTTHGGVLAALALNAIDAEFNTDRALQVRSLSCHFLRPPQHGDLEIEVEQLRVGRRFASFRAELKQGDRVLIAALATHSARALDELVRFMPVPPPAAPAPAREATLLPFGEYEQDGSTWLAMPEQAPPFFHKILAAPRYGGYLFSGQLPENGAGVENGGWVTLPEPRSIDPAYLAFCVDAFWPSVLQPLSTPAIAPTLDLTIHFRAELPPAGLADQPVLIYNNTRAAIDGMADSDSAVYTADGLLLAQGRQLQLVAPVAN